MKKTDFINLLKDVLEIGNEKIYEDTNLHEVKEFDSIAILSLIAFIDKTFHKRLSQSDYQSITTVESLIQLIGVEHFE